MKFFIIARNHEYEAPLNSSLEYYRGAYKRPAFMSLRSEAMSFETKDEAIEVARRLIKDGIENVAVFDVRRLYDAIDPNDYD